VSVTPPPQGAALPNFGCSVLFMRTPFISELPSLTRQHMWGGACILRSATPPIPKEQSSKAFHFQGVAKGWPRWSRPPRVLSPFLPSPPLPRSVPRNPAGGRSGSDVSSPVGSGAKPRLQTCVMYFELVNRIWRLNVWLSILV